MKIKESRAKCCKNTIQIQRLIKEFERVFINKDNPQQRLILNRQKLSLRGGGALCKREKIHTQSSNFQSYIPPHFSSNIKKYSDIIVEQASLISDEIKKNDVLVAFLWFQDNAIYIQSFCADDQLALINYPLIEKTLVTLMKCLHIYLKSSGYLFYQLLQICNCLIRVIFTQQLNNQDRFLDENLKQVFQEQIDNIETLMQIESTNIWITGVEFEIQLIKTWLSHCRTNSKQFEQLGLPVLQEIVLSIVQLKPTGELIEISKFILMDFFECQIKNPIQKYEIYYFFESLKWYILHQLQQPECSVQKQIQQIEEGYKNYIAPSKDWMIHFCWINLISDLITYRPILEKRNIPKLIGSNSSYQQIVKELQNSYHIVSVPYDNNYVRVKIFNLEKSNYSIFKDLKQFQKVLISQEVHELKLWYKYVNFEFNDKQNSSVSDDDLKLQLLRNQMNCDEIFKLNTFLEKLRDEIFSLIEGIKQKQELLLNLNSEQQMKLDIYKQDMKSELKQLKQKTQYSIYICNEIDIKLNRENVKINILMEILNLNKEQEETKNQMEDLKLKKEKVKNTAYMKILTLTEEQKKQFDQFFQKINKYFQDKNKQLFNVWFHLFKFIYQSYDFIRQKDLSGLNKEQSYDQAKFKSIITNIINEVNKYINLVKELQQNIKSILSQKKFPFVIEKKMQPNSLQAKLEEIYKQTFFKSMIDQSKEFIQKDLTIEKWELQSLNQQKQLIKFRSLTLIIVTFLRLLQSNNIKKKIVQEKLNKLFDQTEQTEQTLEKKQKNIQNEKKFKDEIVKKLNIYKTKLQQIKEDNQKSTEANEGEIEEYININKSIYEDIEWICKSDFNQQFKNSYLTIFQEVFNKLSDIILRPKSKTQILQKVLENYDKNIMDLANDNNNNKDQDLDNQNSQSKTNQEQQLTNTQEPENLIKSLSNILQMTKKIRFILKTNLNIDIMMQKDKNKEQTLDQNSQDNSHREKTLKELQEQIQETQQQLKDNISNILDQEVQDKLGKCGEFNLYESYLILFDSNINESNQMNSQFEKITIIEENLNFTFQQQILETFQQLKQGILSKFESTSYKVREALAFNLIKAQNMVQEETIQEICSNLLKQIWIIEKNPCVRRVLSNQEMIEMQKQLFSKDLSLFSNQLKKEMTKKLKEIEELEYQIFNNGNSKELQIKFQQAYDEFEIFLNNLGDMSQKLDISMIFLMDIKKNLQTIKCQLDQLIKNVSEIGNDIRRLRGQTIYQLLKLRKEKVQKQQEENKLNQIYIEQVTKEFKKKITEEKQQKRTKGEEEQNKTKEDKDETFLLKDDQSDNDGEINEFIWAEKTSKDVLLIKGKAGSGKSRAARNIEEFLWKFNNQQLNDWYPIYISLPSLNDPQYNLIDQALQSEIYNFDKLQVREFKEAIQNDKLNIVLILDSYDEMKNDFIQSNLIKTNRLCQEFNLKESGQQKLKVIITCREEILTSNYQSWFYGKSIDTFKEIQLVPFEEKQSSNYIKKFIKLSIIRELSYFDDIIKQLKGSGFVFSEFKNICQQLDGLIEEIIKASQNKEFLVQDQDAKKIVKKLQQLPQYQSVKEQQLSFLQKGLVSLWSEQKFIQTIENLKIKEFLKTPFMLEIIVQILPKISQNQSQSSKIRELFQNNYKKVKYQILYQQELIKIYQQKNEIKLEKKDFKDGIKYQLDDVIKNQLDKIMNTLETQSFFTNYQIYSKLDFQDSSIISTKEYKLQFDDAEVDAEVIYQSLKMNQFTTYDFYEIFVNYYHQQQIQKWMELGKISNQQMITIDLLEFSESLALDMIRQEQFQVNYQPKGRLMFSSINQQKQFQWEDQYFGELDSDSDYKKLVRKCILLNSKGSSHSFTHKQIQEFFVARYIFNLLENKQNNKLSDEQLEKQVMNNDSFNISHEHFQGALLLLKGKLQNKDNIAQLLVQLVRLSKKNSKFIRLASNSIFLLGFLGKNLGKQDFDSVCLSETSINGLSFCESRLSYTFFDKVSIDQCNFNNATITDAKWNKITTKELITKDYQDEKIFEIVLSEDGNEFYVLSSFKQQQIIFRWFNYKLDQEPIEKKFNLKFEDEVESIQIAKDLSTLCCKTKNSIYIWNLKCQNNKIKKVNCIKLRNLSAELVILSQDGRYLFIKLGTTIIWFEELINLKRNKTLTTEQTHDLNGNQIQLAISLDAKLLVIVKSKKIILWDIQDFRHIKEVKEFEHNEDNCNSVAFSKNGNYLVLTQPDYHTIMEINNKIEINKICSFYSINQEEIALISSDNNYIAFYGSKYLAIYQTIKIKQFEQKCRIKHKFENSNKVIVAISNNLELFACTSNFTIHLWNIKGLKEQKLQVLESDKYVIQVLEFSPDCQYLISSDQNKTLSIWDVKQMKNIKKFTSKFEITNLTFSCDGQVLVSYSKSQIVLWDLSKIQEPVILRIIKHQYKQIKFLIISKKQGHIIIQHKQDDGPKCVILVIESGKEINQIEKESSVAIFNDDGNKFATYHQGIVEIWKLQENVFQIEYTLEFHHKLQFFSSKNDDDQHLKNINNYKLILKGFLSKDNQFYQNAQFENEDLQLFFTIQNEFIEIQKIEGQNYYYTKQGPIIEAVFSSDSTILYFATENKQIMIMNISKKEILSQFNIGIGEINIGSSQINNDTIEICRLQLSKKDDILAIAHKNKNQIQIDLYTIKSQQNPSYLKSTKCIGIGIPHTMLFMNNNQYLIIGIGLMIERFDLDNFDQPQLVGFTNENQQFLQYLDGQHIIFVNSEGQICFQTTHSITNTYGADILDYEKDYFIYLKKNTNKIQIFFQNKDDLQFKEINGNTNPRELNVEDKVKRILPKNKSDQWIFRADWKLIIFDLNKNDIIKTIEDEDHEELSDLKLSEDDQYLVTAYADSYIKVWDMLTFKPLFKQKMKTDSLDRVLISSKGILVSSESSKLKIWNFKAQQNFEMDGHIYPLQSMLVSTDGLVLSSQSKFEIKFWDLEELQLLYEEESQDDYFFGGKFDYTGAYFAIKKSKKLVLFKFMSKFSIEKCIEIRGFDCDYFYFTPDSKQIVEIVDDSMISWNLKEAQKLYKLSTQFSNQKSIIKFTISDNCKYAIGNDNFQLFEVDSEMKLKEIKSKVFEIKVLKFQLSHSLNMIAIQSEQRKISIISLSKMEIIEQIQCNNEIREFCFSLNDEFLILLCKGKYQVYEGFTNSNIQIKKTVELTRDQQFDYIFPFQENQFIFINSESSMIQVSQNLEVFKKPFIKNVQSMDAFCTKSNQLAVALNYKEQIHIFNLKNSTEIEKVATLYNVKAIEMCYKNHCNSAIQFSQDCQFLISLGEDQIIYLWDIRDPESIQLRFLKNNISVSAFKILQNQQCQIVLIGNDNSIHKEDYNSNILVATYKKLHEIEDQQIFRMASSDGKYQLYFKVIYGNLIDFQMQSENIFMIENENESDIEIQGYLLLIIYDQEKKQINEKIINIDAINNIQFFDSETLVWNTKKKIIFWKFLINKEEEFQEFNVTEETQYLTCSPNHKLFLSICFERKNLGIFNYETRQQITQLQAFQCSVTQGCLSPCGEKCYIGFEDGSIQLYKFDSNYKNNYQPICYKVFAKNYQFLANNCKIKGSTFTSTEDGNLESLFIEKGAIKE